MKTDLVLSSFNADLRAAVDLAAAVDEVGGIDGLWAYDHFSGGMVGAKWSRHPFVALGAMAAVTGRVRIGPLVANMVNRHPAQLASAINSLQSLAPGRVTCGVGAGAAPGSRFAAEHSAIGRTLATRADRASQLIETIESLRAIWRGDAYRGDHVIVSDPSGIVDGHPPPPIIVGASSTETIALAVEHADGVNIRASAKLADHAATARKHAARLTARREAEGRSPFEVSVMIDLDPDHPLGGDHNSLRALGIDRRILAVRSPYPRNALLRIVEKLGASRN